MAKEEEEKYYTIENFQKGLDECFNKSVKLYYQKLVDNGTTLTEKEVAEYLEQFRIKTN